MNLELHIDALILHGFTPAERVAITEAVERELTRLLTEHRLPSALWQREVVARLDGGVVTVAPDSSPETIGAQVAQALCKGLHV
jgi:hypothetical protein